MKKKDHREIALCLTAPLTRGEYALTNRWARGESQAAFRARNRLTRGDVRRAEADTRMVNGQIATNLPWPMRLRLARKRLGHDRQWIANRLGVTVMTLHTWEKEADPRLILWWQQGTKPEKLADEWMRGAA